MYVNAVRFRDTATEWPRYFNTEERYKELVEYLRRARFNVAVYPPDFTCARHGIKYPRLPI